MLVAGVGLSIAGFIVPPTGEISDSVLMFTAQCLVYAGSALGIKQACALGFHLICIVKGKETLLGPPRHSSKTFGQIT